MQETNRHAEKIGGSFMTPNCNLILIHTCYTEGFTLFWHRLWVLTGQCHMLTDLEYKHAHMYIYWHEHMPISYV